MGRKFSPFKAPFPQIKILKIFTMSLTQGIEIVLNLEALIHFNGAVLN